MIKPPFTACNGLSGHWIKDANGVTVLDINLLIEEPEAERIAEFAAKAMNYLLEQQERARAAGQLGGRPPKKKAARKRPK